MMVFGVTNEYRRLLLMDRSLSSTHGPLYASEPRGRRRALQPPSPSWNENQKLKSWKYIAHNTTIIIIIIIFYLEVASVAFRLRD